MAMSAIANRLNTLVQLIQVIMLKGQTGLYLSTSGPTRITGRVPADSNGESCRL